MAPNIVTNLTPDQPKEYGQITNKFGEPIDNQINERLSQKKPSVKPKEYVPSQSATNRYTNALGTAQKRLNLNEDQAKGFVNNIVGHNGYMNKQQISEVDQGIQDALQKRGSRSAKAAQRKKMAINEVDESNINRYLNVAENVQEKLGMSSSKADGYLKRFGQDGLTKEQAKEVNNQLKQDLEVKKARAENQPYKETAPTIKEHNAKVEQFRVDKAHKEALPMNEKYDSWKKTRVSDISEARDLAFMENRERTFRKRFGSTMETGLVEKRYTADSKAYKEASDMFRSGKPLPMDAKHEVSFAKKLSAREIPTESAIRSKAAQEGAEAVAREGAEQAVKEGAESAAKNGLLKGINKTKIGRVAATVGVGALIVSNMSKNKGQQPNQQLYGQQTPYSY